MKLGICQETAPRTPTKKVVTEEETSSQVQGILVSIAEAQDIGAKSAQVEREMMTA